LEIVLSGADKGRNGPTGRIVDKLGAFVEGGRFSDTRIKNFSPSDGCCCCSVEDMTTLLTIVAQEEE
jgi:hypothetical protein